MTERSPKFPDLTKATAFLRRLIKGKAEGARTEADGRNLRSALGKLLDRIIPRQQSPRPVAPPEPAKGGADVDGSFTNEFGTRAYKLFIPNCSGAGPRPLVVMLHGCTQSPDDFATGTRMNRLAEEYGCLIAYPAQPKIANTHKCWNWFSPEHQRHGEGEPSIIAGITRRIMQEHPVDPRRVYVAGLSAGGAAAVVMGTTYPDLYAAVGVHSGLPYGAARGVPAAFMAMRNGVPANRVQAGGPTIPTIVFHGDQDKTVHPSNGDGVTAQILATGTDLRKSVENGHVPEGHRFTRTIHTNHAGMVLCEQWLVHGSGHAWSGGSSAGSCTDPLGPDASREMLRFFLEHPRPAVGSFH